MWFFDFLFVLESILNQARNEQRKKMRPEEIIYFLSKKPEFGQVFVV